MLVGDRLGLARFRRRGRGWSAAPAARECSRASPASQRSTTTQRLGAGEGFEQQARAPQVCPGPGARPARHRAWCGRRRASLLRRQASTSASSVRRSRGIAAKAALQPRQRALVAAGFELELADHALQRRARRCRARAAAPVRRRLRPGRPWRRTRSAISARSAMRVRVAFPACRGRPARRRRNGPWRGRRSPARCAACGSSGARLRGLREDRQRAVGIAAAQRQHAFDRRHLRVVGGDAGGGPGEALGFVEVAAAERQLGLHDVGGELVGIEADGTGERGLGLVELALRRAAGRRVRGAGWRRPGPARWPGRSRPARRRGRRPGAGRRPAAGARWRPAGWRPRHRARRTRASAAAPRRSASMIGSYMDCCFGESTGRRRL